MPSSCWCRYGRVVGRELTQIIMKIVSSGRLLCSFKTSPSMRRILILVISTVLLSKSFSFSMRRMNHHNQCNNFLNAVSLHSEPSKSAPFSLTQESIERELDRALEFARLMDKQNGLCTEPSRKAWEVVDSIYERMQAIRTEHAMQPFTSNQEQSPRQKLRRKQIKNEPLLQPQAMYFF